MNNSYESYKMCVLDPRASKLDRRFALRQLLFDRSVSIEFSEWMRPFSITDILNIESIDLLGDSERMLKIVSEFSLEDMFETSNYDNYWKFDMMIVLLLHLTPTHLRQARRALLVERNRSEFEKVIPDMYELLSCIDGWR